MSNIIMIHIVTFNLLKLDTLLYKYTVQLGCPIITTKPKHK